MGQARRLLPAFLLLSMTLTIASDGQRVRAATPGIYVALGDSIAVGIGSSLPRSRGNAALVAEWLATLTGETVPFANLAVPGETATTFVETGQLQAFRDTVSRSNEAGIPVAAVSVSLGGNELLSLDSTGLIDRQSALDEFNQRYGEALRAIRAEIGTETPLVVTTYYDLTGGDTGVRYSDAWWIEQFNAVIRRIAAEQNARIADVANAFQGWIDEYTLYPYDVHPSNAGHLTIAQSIWEAMRFDVEAPTLTIMTDDDLTRDTPTIRFAVQDNVSVRIVAVISNEVPLRGPFVTNDNEYSVLLDVGAYNGTDIELTIEIGDDAGNLLRELVVFQVNVTRGNESE